jgi:hypothetical protein
LTLEVGLFCAALKRLGGIPFLVLLALVGSTSFLDTKIGQLVSGLLGEVFSVRLGVVLWLRLSLCSDCAALSQIDWIAISIKSLAIIAIGDSLLLLLVGNVFASFLVIPFAVAGLFAPTMANLLLVITLNVSRRIVSICKNATHPTAVRL